MRHSLFLLSSTRSTNNLPLGQPATCAAALRAYPVPLVSQIGSDPSAPPAVQHPWWPSLQRPHLTAHRFGSSLSAHLACSTLIRSSHTLVVADHPLLLTAFVLADYIWPRDRMHRSPGGYVVPRASHQAVASLACLGRERLMEQPVSSRITSCKTETQSTFRSHEHVFCQVDAYCSNLHVGRSCLFKWVEKHLHFGTYDAAKVGASVPLRGPQ